MNNTATVIIIGVYTLVYVIVFIIQKSQIDRMKEVNNSMKSYMDIFKIEEVKNYVKLKEEASLLQAELFIKGYIEDSEHIKSLVNDVVSSNLKANPTFFDDYTTEASLFAIYFLKALPEEKRIRLLNSFFKKSGSDLLSYLNSKQQKSPTE